MPYTLRFLIQIAFLLIAGFAGINHTQAQLDTNWVSNPDTSKLYKVTRFDGYYFIGHIIHNDARDIKVKVKNRGLVIIPAYLVKSIALVKKTELNESGEYVSNDDELGQYVLNTNAFAIGEGHASVGESIIGPDITIGLSKRFSARITSTWLMTPALATLTYQIL